MGPRYLQSQIHSDYSTGSNAWTEYRNSIKTMYDASTSKVDFTDHLIREYNRKIDRLNQPTGLFIAPYDGGFRFIGNTITSAGSIEGFAYPNETLTAPSGSSYLWTIDEENRGTSQTFTPTVYDIGKTVTCLVGGTTTYTTTVWHPRDIPSVQAFWWAARNAYNVIGNDFTDENRTIELAGFDILITAVTSTDPNKTLIRQDLQNGKNFYTFGNIQNAGRYGVEVFWDNTNSRWTLFYLAPENEEGSSFATMEKYAVGNTEYPWQATWADGTVTGTATTLTTLATDGQTVPTWDDIISNRRVTASSANIALKEDTDLGTPSLRFDSTDFYTVPLSARNIYNAKRWGYIFAGAKDSNPNGGDASHSIVSINRVSTATKIGLRTRSSTSNLFTALTRPNSFFGSDLVVNGSNNNSNYNVLVNECLWSDGRIALRINGSEDAFRDNLGSTSSSDSSSTTSYIGATTSSSINFNGDITAIILASNTGETDVMSEIDRNRIERFIGLLGGLDIPLI
jgi:hypothetical protein